MRLFFALGILVFLCACTASRPAGRTTGDKVADEAQTFVGTPYLYGGNTPEGFDCSGLIYYVYQDSAGLQLPRTTKAMGSMTAPLVSKNQLQRGDLLFFRTEAGSAISHAGIYVGDGRFVHSPTSGKYVRVDSIANSYWRKSYVKALRVADENAP